jgi:putative sigma-54 modulation protein
MTQNVEIFGRDFEVTDHMREYVTKKVTKFERYLDTIDKIRIDLSESKTARSSLDRYTAQMTINGKGFILRSEERSDDIRTAMDAASEKLSRRIERFKEKRNNPRGDGKGLSEYSAVFEPGIEIDGDVPQVIVRRKQFDLIPMAEEEAIEQMKLLGHDNFFVFYNVKVNAVNVLYKRRNGSYGLIEPRVR